MAWRGQHVLVELLQLDVRLRLARDERARRLMILPREAQRLPCLPRGDLVRRHLPSQWIDDDRVQKDGRAGGDRQRQEQAALLHDDPLNRRHRTGPFVATAGRAPGAAPAPV
ncbi:MAG: hypothetical protein DMF86_21835 [Acidobacteria bacterium]|nr:MAG: hypothetical protein DMF86_21835 [Acidobacteriota bacterium]